MAARPCVVVAAETATSGEVIPFPPGCSCRPPGHSQQTRNKRQNSKHCLEEFLLASRSAYDIETRRVQRYAARAVGRHPRLRLPSRPPGVLAPVHLTTPRQL